MTLLTMTLPLQETQRVDLQKREDMFCLQFRHPILTSQDTETENILINISSRVDEGLGIAHRIVPPTQAPRYFVGNPFLGSKFAGGCLNPCSSGPICSLI